MAGQLHHLLSLHLLHLHLTGRPVQRPDVVLRVELLGPSDKGGAGDHLVPDLLEGVEEVAGWGGKLNPPVPLVLQVGVRRRLLGDQPDLVQRQPVHDAVRVDVALSDNQVRHLYPQQTTIP